MRKWRFLGPGVSLLLPLLFSIETVAGQPSQVFLAQLQLTEQPATAEDWLLDAVEAPPPTAETFILAYPGMTAQQAAAVQAIYTRYDGELDAAVDAYLDAINLLNNLIRPEVPNAAIAQVRAEVLTYERRVYDLLFERTMALRSVLTLEQRASLNGLLRSLLKLGTPVTVSTFPAELVGQPIDEVLTDLTLEGWVVLVRTPRTLLLDKDDQLLNLVIGEDLAVAEAELSTEAR